GRRLRRGDRIPGGANGASASEVLVLERGHGKSGDTERPETRRRAEARGEFRVLRSSVPSVLSKGAAMDRGIFLRSAGASLAPAGLALTPREIAAVNAQTAQLSEK